LSVVLRALLAPLVVVPPLAARIVVREMAEERQLAWGRSVTGADTAPTLPIGSPVARGRIAVAKMAAIDTVGPRGVRIDDVDWLPVPTPTEPAASRLRRRH
jgi:hypothetical protein